MPRGGVPFGEGSRVRGSKPAPVMRAFHSGSVELAGGEVGHFVAEDFLEKFVGGGFEAYEGRRDADEALVRVAAAKASGQARAPLDAAFRSEVRDVPEAEPAVEGLDKVRGEV